MKPIKALASYLRRFCVISSFSFISLSLSLSRRIHKSTQSSTHKETFIFPNGILLYFLWGFGRRQRRLGLWLCNPNLIEVSVSTLWAWFQQQNRRGFCCAIWTFSPALMQIEFVKVHETVNEITQRCLSHFAKLHSYEHEHFLIVERKLEI